MKNKRLSFIEWYDWYYVNDDDPNMKINSFAEVVKERYELRNKDYSSAYYDLADVFEEYLKYLEKSL